jgi:hypothetical protein
VTDADGRAPSELEKVVEVFKAGGSSGRVRAAQVIAVLADLLQLGFFPLFVAGLPSPFEDLLDVGVSVAMVILLGWHWAFLPSIITKLIPGLDLIPTWTAAVLFVTRGKGETPTPQPPART